MKILIGADIVPTKSNICDFENGNIENLIDDNLANILKTADFRIFNLEVPLTDNETPITKCGPNLIASTKSVKGIKKIGADFLTLANNHIMDQDEQGLKSTIEVLRKENIAFAGVGNTPDDAAKPYIIEKDNKKIGIYCSAEHEFSIVTEKKAGANPFDPFESLDHIQKLKSEVDYVIVLYHGGKEEYRYPSPYLQKVCRKIIDKGADIVICQHTHCIGCEEKYNDGTIVYGQGNFLFDLDDNEFWQTSLLVSIDIEDTYANVSYLPLEKNGTAVKFTSDNKERILSDFYNRSKEILKPGFIEEKFAEKSEEQFERYICMLQGKRYKSFIFRGINKISGHRIKKYLLKKQYGKSELCAVRNLIECEVHREGIVKRIDTII